MRSYLRYIFLSLLLCSIVYIYRSSNFKDRTDHHDKYSANRSKSSTVWQLWQTWHQRDPDFEIPTRASFIKYFREGASTSQVVDQSEQTLFDFIADGSDVVTEFNFSDCRMHNCFDYSRCNPNGPIKIYITPQNSNQDSDLLNLKGESNIIHENILNVIRASVHHESDPDKACLFILSEDTLDRDPLSKSFRTDVPHLLKPEYNYGMNYLVMNLYSGSWPDYREDDFAGFKIGAAILVKSSNSLVHHRPNFDISIPLFSFLHPTNQDKFSYNESESENRDRFLFLTFKGKRYVFGGGSDTRNSLYHLNNHNDVIMLTTCKHGKNWREMGDKRCKEDELTYSQYEFDDLMRQSTFCLTPRGRRLGSFRFLEALSYDCIPVVLSDGWVWPFDEIIDWSETALQFEESLVFHVPDMLRDIDPSLIETMQRNCRAYYREYFSTVEKIVTNVMKIIEKRVREYHKSNPQVKNS